MNTMLYVISLVVLIVSLSSCVRSDQSKKTMAEDNGRHYKEVVKILQKNDKVVADAPRVHPVTAMFNREAIIPPQCYTKTEGKFNPCYVCHQDQIPERENVMNDADLQVAYSFSDVGLTNHWYNLFEDRSKKLAKISDEAIIDWVNTDNYSELASRLRESQYKGWVPDLKNLHDPEKAFDEYGFARDGSHWVAFTYKPMPSTFWPTNGSTDDVMIRLPEVYRSAASMDYSQDVYRANLAILEANIKGLESIDSLPIRERRVGKDLNKDGVLNTVTHIADVSEWVGAAKDYYIDSFLYPQGTEFLHTVRYLGIEDEKITIPARMKEVRYMKKWRAYPKAAYARQYELEGFEKEAGNLPGYTNLGQNGLDNGNGWSIAGFLEDRKGRLRANTYEENFFCMGCHNSIGSTIDKTFSFARKLDGGPGWGYIDLRKMTDVPNMGEEKGEYMTYFERVGGGDEFRSNREMRERWFTADGQLKTDKLLAAPTLYDIIAPSIDRALALNKAYKVIVEEQSFLFGRDATTTPPLNVYEKVDNENSPTLPAEFTYRWDIRLDWRHDKNK